LGQEYFINSTILEDKIRDLLPSQGGAGAGFDLSASTQIIPVIDVTESAQGSNLRVDLQTSYGFNSEVREVVNGTDILLTTTGYFRLFGHYRALSTSNTAGNIALNNGISDKNVFRVAPTVSQTMVPFDFSVFLDAGHTLKVICESSAVINVVARQIATINGELINP